MDQGFSDCDCFDECPEEETEIEIYFGTCPVPKKRRRGNSSDPGPSGANQYQCQQPLTEAEKRFLPNSSEQPILTTRKIPQSDVQNCNGSNNVRTFAKPERFCAPPEQSPRTPQFTSPEFLLKSSEGNENEGLVSLGVQDCLITKPGVEPAPRGHMLHYYPPPENQHHIEKCTLIRQNHTFSNECKTVSIKATERPRPHCQVLRKKICRFKRLSPCKDRRILYPPATTQNKPAGQQKTSQGSTCSESSSGPSSGQTSSEGSQCSRSSLPGTKVTVPEETLVPRSEQCPPRQADPCKIEPMEIQDPNFYQVRPSLTQYPCLPMGMQGQNFCQASPGETQEPCLTMGMQGENCFKAMSNITQKQNPPSNHSQKSSKTVETQTSLTDKKSSIIWKNPVAANSDIMSKQSFEPSDVIMNANEAPTKSSHIPKLQNNSRTTSGSLGSSEKIHKEFRLSLDLVTPFNGGFNKSKNERVNVQASGSRPGELKISKQISSISGTSTDNSDNPQNIVTKSTPPQQPSSILELGDTNGSKGLRASQIPYKFKEPTDRLNGFEDQRNRKELLRQSDVELLQTLTEEDVANVLENLPLDTSLQNIMNIIRKNSDVVSQSQRNESFSSNRGNPMQATPTLQNSAQNPAATSKNPVSYVVAAPNMRNFVEFVDGARSENKQISITPIQTLPMPKFSRERESAQNCNCCDSQVTFQFVDMSVCTSSTSVLQMPTSSYPCTTSANINQPMKSSTCLEAKNLLLNAQRLLLDAAQNLVKKDTCGTSKPTRQSPAASCGPSPGRPFQAQTSMATCSASNPETVCSASSPIESSRSFNTSQKRRCGPTLNSKIPKKVCQNFKATPMPNFYRSAQRKNSDKFTTTTNTNACKIPESACIASTCTSLCDCIAHIEYILDSYRNKCGGMQQQNRRSKPSLTCAKCKLNYLDNGTVPNDSCIQTLKLPKKGYCHQQSQEALTNMLLLPPCIGSNEQGRTSVNQNMLNALADQNRNFPAGNPKDLLNYKNNNKKGNGNPNSYRPAKAQLGMKYRNQPPSEVPNDFFQNRPHYFARTGQTQNMQPQKTGPNTGKLSNGPGQMNYSPELLGNLNLGIPSFQSLTSFQFGFANATITPKQASEYPHGPFPNLVEAQNNGYQQQQPFNNLLSERVEDKQLYLDKQLLLNQLLVNGSFKHQQVNPNLAAKYPKGEYLPEDGIYPQFKQKNSLESNNSDKSSTLYSFNENTEKEREVKQALLERLLAGDLPSDQLDNLFNNKPQLPPKKIKVEADNAKRSSRDSSISKDSSRGSQGSSGLGKSAALRKHKKGQSRMSSKTSPTSPGNVIEDLQSQKTFSGENEALPQMSTIKNEWGDKRFGFEEKSDSKNNLPTTVLKSLKDLPEGSCVKLRMTVKEITDKKSDVLKISSKEDQKCKGSNDIDKDCVSSKNTSCSINDSCVDTQSTCLSDQTAGPNYGEPSCSGLLQLYPPKMQFSQNPNPYFGNPHYVFPNYYPNQPGQDYYLNSQMGHCYNNPDRLEHCYNNQNRLEHCYNNQNQLRHFPWGGPPTPSRGFRVNENYFTSCDCKDGEDEAQPDNCGFECKPQRACGEVRNTSCCDGSTSDHCLNMGMCWGIDEFGINPTMMNLTRSKCRRLKRRASRRKAKPIKPCTCPCCQNLCCTRCPPCCCNVPTIYEVEI